MKQILMRLLCCWMVLAVTACGKGTAGQQAADNYSVNTENSASDIVEMIPAPPLDSSIDLSGNLRFSAQTPFGEAINSSIFSKYDLTMINIWGTLCKPCIEEMPDIQKLYEDMQQQGVNIIGFVANYQDDRVENAKEILTELDVTYSNVVFDNEVSGLISAQIPGFPTTIFVDSKGNVIGNQISGANSYEKYETIIKERLEECTP